MPNWQTKVSKASHSTQDHPRTRSPLGGLADDDAHAELPDVPDHERKPRKNEVGFILTYASVLSYANIP